LRLLGDRSDAGRAIRGADNAFEHLEPAVRRTMRTRAAAAAAAAASGVVTYLHALSLTRSSRLH